MSPSGPNRGVLRRGALSRRTLLGGALVGLVPLSGCVRIPTSGGIEPVDAEPRQADPSVAVAADPPQPGSAPLGIVTGFLQAMAYYQPDYARAREYLASGVRAKWRPEEGVRVFADNYYPTATDRSASLSAPVVGRIGADGSYRPTTGDISLDFGLVQEDREWRIGHPPPGLLVSQYDFAQFYQSYNLYFYEPTMTSLVPDPIFLPGGNQTATSLVTRLLRGPSDWLTAGVVSAMPGQTTLNVSAPISATGVVEVSFNDAIAGLNDQQRSQVAAQVTWTLRQISGVTGVRLLMNGTPWSVPRDEVDGVVPINALQFDGPVPPQLSSALVGATPAGVIRIEDNGQTTEVPGTWARVKGISSLALSADGTGVAAVVGQALRTGRLDDSQPAQVVTGERLLRPQFARDGGLWTIDSRSGGGSVVWRVGNGGKAERVRAPALADGRVVAYRLSPDGVRMAVLLQRGSDVQLGLVLVNRSKTAPVLESWRTIALYLAQRDRVSQLTDVAWLDATNLMVLGAVGRTAPLGPYVTAQDGATTQSVGNPDQWNATMIAASPRDPAAVRAVLRGSGGQVWRYEDDFTWVQIADGVTTVAFPG